MVRLMVDLTLFNPIPGPDEPRFPALVRFCVEHEGQVLAALPGFAGEVALVFGFEGMLRLVRQKGGTRWLFPGIIDTDGCGRSTVASDILGKPRIPVTEIPASFPRGVQCDLPAAFGVFDALRRVAVFAALTEGVAVAEIARQSGVPDRTLRRWNDLHGFRPKRGAA